MGDIKCNKVLVINQILKIVTLLLTLLMQNRFHSIL